MSELRLISNEELENVVGGQGYKDGFKKLNRALLCAKHEDKSKGWFENKKEQIAEGWGACGSTGKKVAVVATDAAIVGGVGLAATAATAAVVTGSVFGVLKYKAYRAMHPAK